MYESGLHRGTNWQSPLPYLSLILGGRQSKNDYSGKTSLRISVIFGSSLILQIPQPFSRMACRDIDLRLTFPLRSMPSQVFMRNAAFVEKRERCKGLKPVQCLPGLLSFLMGTHTGDCRQNRIWFAANTMSASFSLPQPLSR